MASSFGSSDWIDAFFASIRVNDSFRNDAAGWVHGTIGIVAEPGPDGKPAQAALLLDVHDGEAREVRATTPAAVMRSPFVVIGSWPQWKQVVKGEVDVVDAVMKGTLRLKGDLTQIARERAAIAQLVACAAKVDTAFPDEVEAATAK